MKSGVLYLTYDGVLEPLGQSQVLAYLERLSDERRIHLISFEKPADWADTGRRVGAAVRMASAGITWHPRRYHKRPSALATAWDIGVGTLSALWLVLRHRLGIVHARSYVASVMALAVKRLTGVKYVFDMRGFWADERVDGGLWPRDGRMYRLAKWFERRFLLGADHVVSLTQAAVREMRGWTFLQGRMPPVTVIPTCADLQRFHPLPKPDATAPFTLGYVGSAGTWYMFEAVARAARMLIDMRPESRLLVVNRGEHAYIVERLRDAGVPESRMEIRATDHAGVPAEIARMHAAVFFIKPVFSKQASAPTKLGEFLGCGVPCLANAGVGDMADVLRDGQCGVAIDAFDDASIEAGVRQLLALAAETQTREHCIAAAQRHFSLDDGVARYNRMYASLGLADR
jgi:glycosyltransferase involved in cell wall biosynthesis